MYILVWNCKGAVKPPFANYTKDMMRQYNPDIMCFFETRLAESALGRFKRLFGLCWGLYMVPTIGLSFGIVVVWKLGLEKIDFFHSNRQIAFGIVTPTVGPSWLLGALYAGTCCAEGWLL